MFELSKNLVFFYYSYLVLLLFINVFRYLSAEVIGLLINDIMRQRGGRFSKNLLMLTLTGSVGGGRTLLKLCNCGCKTDEIFVFVVIPPLNSFSRTLTDEKGHCNNNKKNCRGV